MKPHVKICDFGFSKTQLPGDGLRTARPLRHSAPPSPRPRRRRPPAPAPQVLGTRPYMPPELLQLETGTTYDGKEVDVWAAGVLLFTMLVGEYPFGDAARDMPGLLRNITAVQYTMPNYVSPPCQDLIRRIFVKNPKERISLPGLRAHPWFAAGLPPGLAPGPNEVPLPEPPGLQSAEELEALATQALVGAPRVGAPAGAAAVAQPIMQQRFADEEEVDEDMDEEYGSSR